MSDCQTRPSHAVRAALATIALLASGCASMGNTLAQDLAWEQWTKCDRFPNVRMDRVESDGRIWVKYYSAAEYRDWSACVNTIRAEQGRRNVGATAPMAVGAAAIPAAPVASLIPASRPVWRVGDEWAYRWESPQGAGTFVWSVDREEVVDGVEYYVLKTGQREIFLRKGDLAVSVDKVSGDIETRYVPPRPILAWPLAPGKSWQTTYTRERPKDRQTFDTVEACQATGEETMTVPAGTFQTVKVECRNQKTNTMMTEVWYAPAVRHYIRERSERGGGIQVRELIAYKIK